MIPTSLYIHTPWCIRKCPYCDFNSHKSPDLLPEEQYIDALIDDFRLDINRLPKRDIQTIFIGGGTPSLLSASAYARLFEQLQQLVTFSNDIEITLEANPGTAEQQRFSDYRAIGINRLSLGIQSFDARQLKKLGRIHDDKQAHDAIKMARLAGFDNINIDIMHSLPNQTAAEGLADLQQALEYQPEHISWYQLTLEPNTVFYKQRPTLPDEDTMEELEHKGLMLLANHGFERYEISAFCKPKKEARHNLNYWLFGDYYGIGAGAHGKITLDNHVIYRSRKQRQPSDYLDSHKSFLAENSSIDTQATVFEFMLNATRLQQPIANQLFTKRTGLPFSLLQPGLEKALAKQLVILESDTWQVSKHGRRFTNNLQELFLNE